MLYIGILFFFDVILWVFLWFRIILANILEQFLIHELKLASFLLFLLFSAFFEAFAVKSWADWDFVFRYCIINVVIFLWDMVIFELINLIQLNEGKNKNYLKNIEKYESELKELSANTSIPLIYFSKACFFDKENNRAY